MGYKFSARETSPGNRALLFVVFALSLCIRRRNYTWLCYFDIETDGRLLDTKPALRFQLGAMDSLPSVLVISDDVITKQLLS